LPGGGQVDLKLAAEGLIRHLRCKEHKEKPHISVLGPPHRLVLRRLFETEGIPISEVQHTGEEEEEEEEEDYFLESDTLYTRPVWWIMGCRFSDVEVHDKDKFSVSVAFRFYVRKEPPSKDSEEEEFHRGKYNKVETRLKVSFSSALARLKVYSDSGSLLYDSGDVPVILKAGGPIHVSAAAPLGASAFRTVRHLKQSEVSEVNISGAANYLRATDVKRRSSEDGREFVHSFSWSASIEPTEGSRTAVEVRLMNLGGFFPRSEEGNLSLAKESPYVYVFDRQGGRWSIGFLLEVEGEVEVSGGKINAEWGPFGLTNITPMNTMAFLSSDKTQVELKDYAIEEEAIKRVEEGTFEASNFLKDHIPQLLGMSGSREVEAVADALVYSLRRADPERPIPRLRRFQEETAEKVLKRALQRRGGAVVVTSRAAGGKTLAFLVPVVFYAAITKAREQGKKGVKAIIFYPTKALANDQLDEAARLIYFFNSKLAELGLEEAQVTVGVLHGDVYSRFSRIGQMAAQGWGVPVAERLYCPEHPHFHLRGEIDARQRRRGGSYYIERLECSKHPGTCKGAQLLSRWLRLTREAVYSDPPDILVADIDVINAILMRGKDQRGRAFEHSIFGRRVRKCPVCGATYADLNKRRCDRSRHCGRGRLEELNGLSYPKIIVIDEAHVLRGSFGIQAHYVLRRMEQAIKTYNVLSGDWRPLYVLASATLENAVSFTSHLLDVNPSEVEEVRAKEVEEGEREPYKRYFTFIMPKAYAQQATAVRTLSYLYGNHAPIKGIVFTNRLSESNELSASPLLKEFLVGGHSTDYATDERVRIELEFNAGDKGTLVATRTLELGIDYGYVNYVLLYGMPYYLSELVQRIGRAGRRGDALILLVFNPDHAVDYFFYTNYRLITDGSLREQALGMESWLPNLDNEEAIRRSVRRALLDYLCVKASQGREKVFFGGGTLTQFTSEVQRALSGQGLSLAAEYISAISPKLTTFINTRRPELQFFAGEVIFAAQASRRASLEDLSRYMKEGDILWELRHSDDEVRISYEGERSGRRREMSMAIRTLNVGQVCSFKGRFYIVNSITGDKVPLGEFLRFEREGGESSG